MVELVFKYPEKKPPFFGIKFDVETEGMMLNQSWVRLKGKEWNARMEILGKKMELTIYSKKEFRHTYVVNNYDSVSLKKFLRETRQNDKINFGHVTQNSDGSHKIIRTGVNNAAWVLPITKIEVLSEH